MFTSIYYIFLQGALIVGILNIQIPQVMGGVVNVIAKFHSNEKFMDEIREPALKLSFMYIAQVCRTQRHRQKYF